METDTSNGGQGNTYDDLVSMMRNTATTKEDLVNNLEKRFEQDKFC